MRQTTGYFTSRLVTRTIVGQLEIPDEGACDVTHTDREEILYHCLYDSRKENRASITVTLRGRSAHRSHVTLIPSALAECRKGSTKYAEKHPLNGGRVEEGSLRWMLLTAAEEFILLAAGTRPHEGHWATRNSPPSSKSMNGWAER